MSGLAQLVDEAVVRIEDERKLPGHFRPLIRSNREGSTQLERGTLRL